MAVNDSFLASIAQDLPTISQDLTANLVEPAVASIAQDLAAITQDVSASTAPNQIEFLCVLYLIQTSGIQLSNIPPGATTEDAQGYSEGAEDAQGYAEGAEDAQGVG